MASVCSPSLTVPTFPAKRTLLATSSFIPLLRNRASDALKVSKPSQYFNFRVSRKGGLKGNVDIGTFDRRNALFGIGGLCGTLSIHPLSLDMGMLGHVYSDVDVPPRVAQQRFVVCASQAAETPKNNGDFPLILDSVVSIVVERPNKFGNNEKEEKREYLVIEGIELDVNSLVTFDVLINAEEFAHLVEADDVEYLGCFYNVPHGRGGPRITRTSLTLTLTQLIEDLEIENDDRVTVTFVPKSGQAKIGNVRIE